MSSFKTREGIYSHCIPPPIWELNIWSIRYPKEDDDPADGKASVQCRSKDIVVLCPPGIELPINDLVEGQIDEIPAAIVDSRRRRDVVSSDKNERPVDLSHKIITGLFPNEIGDGRQNQANPEEVQQAAIDGPDGIESCRANETPNLGQICETCKNKKRVNCLPRMKKTQSGRSGMRIRLLAPRHRYH